MKKHINLSVEELLKTALEGRELTHSTMNPDTGEQEDYVVHFHESPKEIRELISEPGIRLRMYPELRNRALFVGVQR